MATKLEIILELQNRISNELKAVKGDLDRLNASAKKTSTQVDRFGKSMKSAGTAATGLKNILLPLVGITLFVGALRKIAEFEQAMAGVAAVITPTREEFVALNAEARRLGAVTVFSASQAASGLEFLGRAGFSANEAIAALEGTLNLAAAGGIGLGEAADIASNVLSGFNLEAAEAGRVADVLAATAASANTNILQLGDAIKFVAPIAAAMGVPLETAAAAIGKLSDAGLQGSTAGTGLRKILAKLNTPSKQLTTVMSKLGLKTKDVAVTGDNLAEVMKLLGDAGLGAADALQLFGDRGAPAALALANVSDELQILNDDLKESEGRAEAMAAVMSDTLVGSFKQLNSAIEETLLQTGDAGLLGNLRTLIDTLAGVVRTLNGTQDALDENAVLYREIADAVESFGTFLKILIGFKVASFLGGIASGLAKAITAMKAATVAAAGFRLGLVALGRAALLAMGPLGWIVGIGLALVSFATKDAPKAIDALKDLKKETDAFSKALEGLDSATIELDLAINEEKLNDAKNKLKRVNDDLDKVTFFSASWRTRLLEQEQSGLQKSVTLLEAKNKILISEAKKVAEQEVKIAKDKVNRLARLSSEAQQAEISAINAATDAKNKIAQQELAFAKKVAKDREIIGTASLKQQLTKQEISTEEYYFRVGLLAEERLQADKDILAAKLQAVKDNQAQELAALQDAQDVAVGGAQSDAEVQQINIKFEQKRSALESNFAVELNDLKLQKDKLAIAIAASDAQLETQELEALRKEQTALEIKQKEGFEKELARIQEQQVRKAEALERDVEAGTINQFELAGEIAVVDEEAILAYQALLDKAKEYNATVQDPNNVVAINSITDAIQESSERINPELEKIKTNLTDGLASAFEAIADGSKTAEEAFKDYAKSFLREILKMITQAMALQAVKAAFGGFSGGGLVTTASTGGYIRAATGGYVKGAMTGKAGYVQGFAEGGYITGKGTATSDSIDAKLSNKEYVVNAGAVKHYGVNFMEAVNRMRLPVTRGLPNFSITRPRRAKFATGGSVSGAANNETSNNNKPPEFRIINQVDPDLVEGYMNSRDGEETILNLISNNKDKIKGVLS